MLSEVRGSLWVPAIELKFTGLERIADVTQIVASLHFGRRLRTPPRAESFPPLPLHHGGCAQRPPSTA